MVTKKFTCKMHADYGTLGWVMNTMPHFDPGVGMQIAHDCMEHLTRRVGFEGEMEAFGVALYIRHGGGYWQERQTSPRAPKGAGTWAYNTSTEIAEFLARDTDLTVGKAPRTPLLEDEDAEEQITEVQARALEDFYSEWAESYGLEDTPEAVIVEALARASVWIRRGWLNAQRKYGANPYDLAYLFTQIEKEVDALTPEEGDTLSITLDRDNVHYEVKHRKPYERW